MVNVNTQVTSSTERPLGECTIFIGSVAFSLKGRERCQSAAVSAFSSLPLALGFSMACAMAVPVHVLAGSQLTRGRRIIAIRVWLFHTAVVQEVCQRYGGC